MLRRLLQRLRTDPNQPLPHGLVFKFATAETALTILRTKTLAFPTVRALNDPFESSIQSSLDLLQAEIGTSNRSLKYAIERLRYVSLSVGAVSYTHLRAHETPEHL